MKISKIIEENKDSIIQLAIEMLVDNNQRKISIRGTGFIISEDGKFITNAHVYKQISEEEKPYLIAKVPGEKSGTMTKYESHKIKLLEIDEENDVAIFKLLNDKKYKNIDGFLNSELVREGDRVVYMGYPLATELLSLGFGITLSTNSCIISSIKRRGSDGSLHYFMVDTHTNPGSSGSPVFSEKSGKILGIVSGNISSKIPGPDGKEIMVPANMGICRPATYIEKIIKDINKLK